MKKNPLVSVIVPTYKEEKYIEATLRSIKNQDYKGEYEIIVVDSNSKDRTVKIAKKFADRVIVVKKRGVSVGRNIGARIARGDVLMFVDADTMLLPNVISKVVKYLKRKHVVGVIVPIIGDDLTKNVFYFTGSWIYYLLTKVKLQPVYAVCFACKKDAFFKVGGFDERLRVAEDIELGSRLKKLGDVEYVKDTFAITSSRRLKRWNLLKQLKAWPFGYLYVKLLNKQPEYPPVR